MRLEAEVLKRELVGRCAVSSPGDQIVWKMPFKSQEFERGPELVQRSQKALLRLDYETPSGLYAWKTVTFTGVWAITFTSWQSCTRDQIAAYDKFVEVENSRWLEAILRVEKGTRHFRVFFDEIGCYDIAATEIRVDDEDVDHGM